MVRMQNAKAHELSEGGLVITSGINKKIRAHIERANDCKKNENKFLFESSIFIIVILFLSLGNSVEILILIRIRFDADRYRQNVSVVSVRLGCCLS